MTYLVDANVLSELTKRTPDPRVVSSLSDNERRLVVDPIILGELRFGILVLAAGRRRRDLERWFEDIGRRVQCVPWDTETGLRWAALLARLRGLGKPMQVKDSLIAATALVHGFVLATRNTRDFEASGVEMVNPFA